MTTVYIDTLFLINALIDYILLLGTARFSGHAFSRKRLLIAAIFGGVYSAAIFFPSLTQISSLAGKFIAGIFIVFIAFGYLNIWQFLRRVGLFFFISFVFGGGVTALYNIFGINSVIVKNGAMYTSVSIKTLMLFVAVCYLFVRLFFTGGGKAADSGRILRIGAKMGDRKIFFSAFEDTGNFLRDSISNSRVILVERETILQLFPSDVRCKVTDESMKNIPELFSELHKAGEIPFRLVAYSSVGNEGMLIAFRPDWIEINGKEETNILLAISPTTLSGGTGYCALIGH